jgi:porphobilinogen synthase
VTSFPVARPRRWRQTAAHRRLAAETTLARSDLVLPLFVGEGLSQPVAIASMPGVVRHTTDSLRRVAADAAGAGLGGLMLFGVPARKDAEGSGAWDSAGVLNRALAEVVAEVGDALLVMADLCLDEFTDHGHCGVLGRDPRGRVVVDNDATLQRYALMAQAQAAAGAHVVGTSGMMDGQVGAVRAALDDAGQQHVAVLAYAAKYASAFYGPFREAVGSSLAAAAGTDVPADRATYQQDPANGREALREVLLDVAEGADAVMVKPATGYLDVVAAVRSVVDVPVAAYHVSGEMAMVEAAAERGWIDRDRAVLETLVSIKRAGADIVLTYWALDAVVQRATSGVAGTLVP